VNCCSDIVYQFACRLGETDLPVDDIAAVCLLVNIRSSLFILKQELNCKAQTVCLSTMTPKHTSLTNSYFHKTYNKLIQVNIRSILGFQHLLMPHQVMV
jgi:hypothetical protein